ncbi:PAS domain-containing sensor histidine kinase [Halobellus rufus]|uniref:PAS domain-containing sensor histidine kinase n=1 Tax=Halobellus rufus TaxID=1448860 RepID=UPI0006789325|nr:PAS domain-containing sensor histidine kinase [Halobellus rufus]
MVSHVEPSLPSEYDTLRVGIALYDPRDGSILDANDRLTSIFGYGRADLRGLGIDRYTANTYPFSASDFRDRLTSAATGDVQRFTWRVKRGDGELIWVRVHLSRQVPAGGDHVLAEIRDVTDHYDASHREELFWRILRHNLRNKAAIITGYAEEIADGDDIEQARAAARTIHEAATKLGDTATSVKEIQHAVVPTAGDRHVRNATRAIREVVADFREEYSHARISVTEREALWIDVDDAFSYALSHAVENAIVHSDDSAPVVDLRVGRSPNTGRVEIAIEDTNPPIRDAELDALFRPAARTNTVHGSGVGLFVMRWCVESLGGEIGFERQRPQGNTVRMYLPPKEPPTEQ